MEKSLILGAALVALISVTGCGTLETKSTAPPKNESAVQEQAKTEQDEQIRLKMAEIDKQRFEENQRLDQIRQDDLINNGVILNYTIQKTDANKYLVSGETNLPDNTQLVISLSNRRLYRENVMGISDDAVDTMESWELAQLLQNTFSADSKVKVYQGKFSALFGSGKAQIAEGEYELGIASLTYSLQYRNVQEQLGKNGANLFGYGVYDDGVEKRIVLDELIYLQ